ncbi:hypothetical protein NKG05_27185 [Oerskovia sp. M15]
MFGDVLENLTPQDLRPFGRIDQLGADHPLVAAPRPTRRSWMRPRSSTTRTRTRSTRARPTQ